jgi:hypothetical protein
VTYEVSYVNGACYVMQDVRDVTASSLREYSGNLSFRLHLLAVLWLQCLALTTRYCSVVGVP